MTPPKPEPVETAEEFARCNREACAIAWYSPNSWRHMSIIKWVASGEPNAGIPEKLLQFADLLQSRASNPNAEAALVADAEARGANAARHEAFAQVSRELREWASQHVNAGYPEVQKTLLVAAQVYAEKSEYTKGGADGG